MIQTIQFNGNKYPKFQSEGFASRFAFPFAQQVCKGHGIDVGCGSIMSWCFPGAIPVDPSMDYDSYKNLLLREGFSLSLINELKLHNTANDIPVPPSSLDYLYSSHCLEHVPDWVSTLMYWHSLLKSRGTLFLYLPHPDQEYWRPWNNRKHVHVIYPRTIREYLESGGWTNVFVGERDLNHSFMAMAEKV